MQVIIYCVEYDVWMTLLLQTESYNKLSAQ